MNHKLDVAATGTDPLVLRPWRISGARAVSQVYDHHGEARRLDLSPADVSHLIATHMLLEKWITDADHDMAPAGRWAVERAHDRRVIGAARLRILPSVRTWASPGDSTPRSPTTST